MAVNSLSVTSPIVNTGTGTDPIVGVQAPLPTSDGGTGTSSPALVEGPGIAISGNWPDQMISATLGWFNIADYGATDDGTTDCAVAIQAAVNDANSAYASSGVSQVVWIPPGRWALYEGIYERDGVSWKGAGKFQSVLVGSASFIPNPDRPSGYNGVMCGLIMLDGQSTSERGVPLVGITIEGIGFDLNQCPNVWNTTSTTALSPGTGVTITPASMAGITTGLNVTIDPGSNAETVSVISTTSTTFTANLTKSHASGVPIDNPNYTPGGILAILQDGIRPMQKLTLRDISLELGYNTTDITANDGNLHAGIGMYGLGIGESYDVLIEDVWSHNGSGPVQVYHGAASGEAYSVHGITVRNVRSLCDKDFILDDRVVIGGNYFTTYTPAANIDGLVVEDCVGYIEDPPAGTYTSTGFNMVSIDVLGVMKNVRVSGTYGRGASIGTRASNGKFPGAGNVVTFRGYNSRSNLRDCVIENTYGEFINQSVAFTGFSPDVIDASIIIRNTVGRSARYANVVQVATIATPSGSQLLIIDGVQASFAPECFAYFVQGAGGTYTSALLLTDGELAGDVVLANVQGGANCQAALGVNGTGWLITATNVNPPTGFSSLTAAISAGATSIPVANTAVFEAGQYVALGSDVIEITGISGTTLTTTPTASSHVSGSAIGPSLTSNGYRVTAPSIRISRSYYNTLTTWATSVPASGASLVNPYLSDMNVAIGGGSISAIAINGVNQGLTSGNFIVRAGDSITLTYSSAPTSFVWRPIG